MPAKKVKDAPSIKRRPAMTPDAREAQMISLATDLAEQQLRDGTASSQTINFYLKLGSSKERIEKEILKKQEKLIAAKTENLESQKKSNELYAEVLSRMRIYAGGDDSYEETDL